MKKWLVFIVLFFFAFNVLAEGLMVGVSFDKINNEFSIDWVVPVKSDVKQSKGEGSYFIVFKENNYKQAFEPNTTIIVEPEEDLFDENGNQIYFPDANDVQRELNFVSLTLLVPYSESVYTLQIKNKEGKILAEENIGFIQEQLAYEEENEIQNKLVKDESKEKQKSVVPVKEQASGYGEFIAPAFVLIAMLILLFLFFKHKKKAKNNSKKLN